jgi:Flp pilus assembly protein TadD
MKHDRGWGFRGAIVAAALGYFALGTAAQAQTGATGESSGAALRRQLAELAANPTSVSELVETGRAALGVGDGEGALGFFTRASQLAPRDARVTAGLAAANVRTGRPETALLLFAEARSLGAPEAEIAADRGLAYDLLGQTARAQQDYLLSLRHREDAEVRRRLALSLAISGQRDAALRLVEDQARRGDAAGQRARVFVLALSGDVRGASDAATASLPRQAAQSLTPFLTRLAALSPGDKASAANLGRVPSGMRQAAASIPAVADPAALAFAGGGVPAALSNRLPVASPVSTGPRRRPGGVAEVAGVPARATQPALPTAEPARVLASASMPIERPAARTLSPNGPRLSHPHQPLRRNGAAPDALEEPVMLGTRTRPLGTPLAAPAMADAAPDLTAPAPAAAPVPAMAATTLGAALPADDRLAGGELGSGGPNAVDDTTTAALTTSVQPAYSAPADEPEPQPEPAAQLTDGAAANLAVWNSGSPAVVGAPPVAARPQVRAQAPSTPQVRAQAPSTSPARTDRPGFSDVVATVSSLPTGAAGRNRPPAPSASRQSAPTRQPAQRATPTATARATPRTLPTETASPAARPTTRTPAAGSAAQTRTTRTAAATARAGGRGAAPRETHPSRVWVQLGVSQNRSGFTYEIGRLRQAAPELRSRQAHTAPIGSSHRLLVGPFASEDAARGLIAALRQKNVQAMTWTSPAGTEVTRFGGQ